MLEKEAASPAWQESTHKAMVGYLKELDKLESDNNGWTIVSEGKPTENPL